LLPIVLAGCAGSGSEGYEPAPSGAASQDFSAPAPDTKAQVVFFPRVGSPMDDERGALGPAVVLMNTNLAPASVFAWVHSTVNGRRVAGDVVALCTRGGDVYSEALLSAGWFNSVQTVLVPSDVAASELAPVANRLADAEVVYLGDGDAAAYAAWSSTPLGDAVRAVYYRGGVVVGAGPGAGALGWTVLTSNTSSTQALADPYSAGVTLVPGAIRLPLLRDAYVDRDLQRDDRFGALAAMTARAVADGLADAVPSAATGIGLAGNSALAIDRAGNVTLFGDGDPADGAWLVRGGAVDPVRAGQPLRWSMAHVTRLDAPGESFSTTGACGTAFSYDVSIDGSAAPPFTPSDPYGAQGSATPCPP
jgi:hypothetical protein